MNNAAQENATQEPAQPTVTEIGPTISLRLPAALLAQIDGYAASIDVSFSRSAAIRRLCALALKAEAKP